jgi:hypothetical protein
MPPPSPEGGPPSQRRRAGPFRKPPGFLPIHFLKATITLSAFTLVALLFHLLVLSGGS